MKNLRNLLILVAVLALGVVAGLSVSNRYALKTPKEIPAAIVKTRQSWVGGYLSGYHAAQNKDYETASTYFAKSLTLRKSSPTLESQAMTLLLVSGKFSEAFELAKSLSSNSDNGLAKLALIIDAVEKSNFKKAQEIGSEVAADSANNTIINQLLLGWTTFGMGKTEEAKGIFTKLKKDGVLPTLSDYNLALFLQLSGDKNEAAKVYDNMLKTKKLPIGMAASAYNFYAGNEKKQQFIVSRFGSEKQIKKHRKIDDIKDAVAEALMGVGGVIMTEYGPDQAAALFRLATYLNPELDEAKLLLGSILMNEGDFKAANNILRQIGHDSYLTDYAKLAIARNFEEMNQDSKARQYFETLVDNDETRLDALVSLGDIVRKSEDYAKAAEYYTQAIDFITEDGKKDKINKKYWAVFFARGVCYERLKEYDKFEKDLKIALKLYPDQPDALNYLGYTWIDLGKNLEEAKQLVLKAHRQRPDDPHITDSVGWALYKLGEHEQAVDFIEKAATQMPYDPTVNDHLGDIYWTIGRRSEAQYQWQRALDNDPDDKLAVVLQEKLENGLVKVADNAE